MKRAKTSAGPSVLQLARLMKAQSGVEGRSAGGAPTADAAAAPCPPALTGGESVGKAKIDWCTLTWLPEPDEHIGATVQSLLLSIAGGRIQGEEAPGMYGYEFGVRYFVDVNGTRAHVGRVDYGGEFHKGRARLDLSGSACQLVNDWLALRTWAGRQWEVKLTRVDLAVDCLLGEFTVEDARDWYLAGDFNAGGRMPRHSTPGDWLTPQTVHGRTLEVGRRENGKMCRVYEKGRQLGDSASSWTRFEVEWRNNDRDLPLDVLTDCDRYFAGAYKCLQRLLDAMPERIPTHQKEGEIALEKLTVHARSAYGCLIDVLRVKLSASEVLDALARPGVPGRLLKSSLAEFMTAASPLHHLKDRSNETKHHRL